MPKMATMPAAVGDALVTGATKALHNRRLMRAPIHLYRARLGFLFGTRMLMLEHIGRKSGARRYVVLEVIDHPEPDTYVVVSGFGTRAQWFRNLQSHPEGRVWTGLRAAVPTSARVMSSEESAASLHSYITRHRRAWNALKPAIENTFGAEIDETAPGIPMVQLRLHH